MGAIWVFFYWFSHISLHRWPWLPWWAWVAIIALGTGAACWRLHLGLAGCLLLIAGVIVYFFLSLIAWDMSRMSM